MKRFFTSLIISAFLLVGFGYSDNAYIFTNVGNSSNYFFPGDCWLKSNQSWTSLGVKAYNLSGDLIRDFSGEDSVTYSNIYCMDFSGYLLKSNGDPFKVSNWTRWDVSPLFPSCPTCEEQYTSLECEQEYGLMPIASCNAEYCELNEYCTGNTASSQLFINGIRQQSMPFINLYIPEEIQRDYNYTGNSTQLDINIEGYGYDTEKMQSIVNTQYYKPTAEEMSGLVEKISDFLPLVAVALLIIWIRRVLKKIFRF